MLKIVVFCVLWIGGKDAKNHWRVSTPDDSVANFSTKLHQIVPRIPSPGHHTGAYLFFPSEIMLSLPLNVKHLTACSSIWILRMSHICTYSVTSLIVVRMRAVQIWQCLTECYNEDLPWSVPKVRVQAKLCPTLCNPMDCSLPGSSVHGILQTRILEWVTLPSSRGSSQPRDWTHISYVSCIGRQVLYH